MQSSITESKDSPSKGTVKDDKVVVVVVEEVACVAEAICIADSRSGGGGASSRRRNHQAARTAMPIRVAVVKSSFFVMFYRFVFRYILGELK